MKKFNGKLFASLALGMMLVGVLAISVAAQTGGSTPATGGKATPDRTYYNLYQDKLAVNLGVTRDKLTQSQDAAFTGVLAQMVTDGKLTQAQADKLAAARDKVQAEGFGALLKGAKDKAAGKANGTKSQEWNMKASLQEVYAAVASKLGLTAEQLTAEIKSGKNLLEVAKAKNVSEADLRAVVVAKVKEIADRAVAAGKLTREQADRLVARFTETRLDKLFRHELKASK